MHCFATILTVPVGIENHTRVCGRQIDSHSSRPGTQQHDKGGLAAIPGGILKPINGRLPLLARDASVDALKRKIAVVQIILQNVQHDFELGKNENSMAVFLEARQGLVQQDELSGSVGDKVTLLDLSLFLFPHVFFDAIQQKQVVAALAELHGQIVETGPVQGLFLVLVQKSHILFVEGPVILFLRQSQLDLDERLLFRGDTFLYIFFESAKYIWTNVFM